MFYTEVYISCNLITTMEWFYMMRPWMSLGPNFYACGLDHAGSHSGLKVVVIVCLANL